jgi:hypothetical protein
VGDYVVDQSGAMYVCTVAGSPGTWQLSGVSVNENIAGKNFIINGGMDIWQRGTSFTNAGSTTANTTDRWVAYRGGFANGLSVSRQATSDTTNLPFIQYCARVQRASGDTSTATLGFETTLETSNSIPMAGKNVTLSFWARAGANYSPTSSALGCVLTSGTGTDQNYISGFTGSTQIFNVNVTLTSTWKLYSLAGIVGSTATQLAAGFFAASTGTAGTNDYFDITGVQLEIAPQATPFSRAGGSIGGELALCQRYYTRFQGGSYNQYGFAAGINSGYCSLILTNPVPFRAIPTTLDLSALSNLAIYQTSFIGINAIVFDAAGTISTSLNVTPASTPTAGQSYRVLNNGTSNGYIGLGAEL